MKGVLLENDVDLVIERVVGEQNLFRDPRDEALQSWVCERFGNRWPDEGVSLRHPSDQGGCGLVVSRQGLVLHLVQLQRAVEVLLRK